MWEILRCFNWVNFSNKFQWGDRFIQWGGEKWAIFGRILQWAGSHWVTETGCNILTSNENIHFPPLILQYLSLHLENIIKQAKRRMASEQLSVEILSINQQQPTIQCQNRKFLAGSSSKNFPITLPKFVHKDFTAIKITDKHQGEDIKSLGAAIRPTLDSMFQANKSAVLIKDLPITVGKDFHDFVEGCAYEAMTYESGSGFRAAVDDLVYTASDEPPPFSIEPHNEMSYLSKFPQKVTTYSSVLLNTI